MELLNYQVLKDSEYGGFILEKAPEKVLQFGEGNFMRAFVDYWFDMANERAGWNGKCVIVQPISNGMTQFINNQQGLYTLYLRGVEGGDMIERKRVISSVSRCLDPYEDGDLEEIYKLAVSDDLEFVVSNTTEIGIAYDPGCHLKDRPASSFPGKLTQILYKRWKAGKSGLVILSCELIEDNAVKLKRCVRQYAEQWSLGDGFMDYVNNSCTFCQTLIDRIVPGRIRDPKEAMRLDEENGYSDPISVVGELFGAWQIEGPDWLNDRLPFKRAGLDCAVVPDIKPYRTRKVRILNAAHTGFVPGGYLSGYEHVRDCMRDSVIRGFMNKMIYDEIIPVLPEECRDVESYAAAVQDRFDNPFVNHELLTIAEGTVFKWRDRNLPSLLDYVAKKGELPPCLSMSFAELLAFCTCDLQGISDSGLVCRRSDGETYVVLDKRWVLEFINDHIEDEPEIFVSEIMENAEIWGCDLTEIPGFYDKTVENLRLIRESGAEEAFRSCL